MSSELILHQGAHFVAADKPAGWLSVPGRFGARDPRPVLGLVLQERLGARLWPVPRLDEEATGVVLFALDAPAHAQASAWFEHRRVRKSYEALTEIPAAGPPHEGFAATWTSLLLRGKKRAYESPAGKSSETRARFRGVAAAPGGDALAWDLEPITGRPHQLRFETARHGWPILGDELYGARRTFVPGAIALRCVRLAFLEAEAAAALGLPASLAAPDLASWLADAARAET